MENILGQEWLPATSTFNYMMKDPLIDWLEQHYLSFTASNPKFKKEIEKEIPSSYNFTEYIMEQGKIFERKVIEMIIERFGKDRVVQVNSEKSPRNPEKAKETLGYMNCGIPIIHGGLVYNPENQTFGIPDLLVRSDWINFLVKTPVLLKDEEKKKATNLQGHWHYRAIDIKYKCLSLKADQKHLLNSSAFPAYKSQLCINNMALGYMQGYLPDQVYILGRRWDYSSKGQYYSGNSCFDRLGIIDYKKADEEYVELTFKALEWLKEVRKDESRKWNILDYPLSKVELYPNMKNKFNSKWDGVKKQIATQTKELTSLWMIGAKSRNIAVSKGISKWTDKQLTPAVCGIYGKKISTTLTSVININQGDKIKILPKIILNNFGNWKTKTKEEFFVDFETYDGVISRISNPLKANTDSMIFMIGVGYFNGEKWVSKQFITDRLTHEEELRICSQFISFLKEKNEPKCIHWSQAEPSMWSSALKRHPEINQFKPQWLDLLKVFKEEPIVIKGSMSFSLKDVAFNMKKHKMIDVCYDGPCADGLSALVGSYHSHRIATEKGVSMKETDVMKQIAEYNKIDVLVIYEIISYLRENHLVKKRKRGEIITDL